MQVGGEFFNTTLFAMNEFGRVAVCGAISTYNQGEEQPKGDPHSILVQSSIYRIRGSHPVICCIANILHYCIAGKFGGELDLVVWLSVFATAK